MMEAWREPFCKVSGAWDQERDLIQVVLNEVHHMGVS